MNKKNRQLIILCGLSAGWRGETEVATHIHKSLDEFIPDAPTRQKTDRIFMVLLDSRRLTQPDYGLCHRLLENNSVNNLNNNACMNTRLD